MTARELVVVSGGLRQPSSTRMLADRLADATAAALADHGQQTRITVVELREVAHDVVNALLTGFPAGGLPRVLDQVARADGLVAVSPVFTTAYSGLFKSFVDALEPEVLRGMPVLLGATGGTPRHSLAPEYAMRPLFTYLHADVVTTSVFAATDDWADGGDAGLVARIERAGGELAARVAARPVRATGPGVAGGGGAGGTGFEGTASADEPFANTPSFADLMREHGVQG